MKSSLIFKVPVFTLGFSPPPESLLANFLGYASITITSGQLTDLNTKLCLHGVWGRNWAGGGGGGGGATKFNKKYFYISLCPFPCNENHTNFFTKSILRNRRKYDSKTFLVHILLFMISTLFSVCFSYITKFQLPSFHEKDSAEKLPTLILSTQHSIEKAPSTETHFLLLLE